MNAIILASVFAGAYTIFLSANPEQTPVVHDQVAQIEAATSDDPGSMTRDVTVNPKTGEEEEISVIAFLDQ